METTDKSLVIAEPSDDEKKEEEKFDSKMKIKMLKKQNSDFLKENELNKATEIISDEFETEIEKNMQNLEDTGSLTYDSDSEGEVNGGKKGVGSVNSSSDSNLDSDEEVEDDDDETNTRGNTNNQLIEANVLQRRKWDESGTGTYGPYQQFRPFYERRRLSECKEEDEEEEKPIVTVTITPTISLNNEMATSVTSDTSNVTEVTGTHRRFIVTKAEETPEPLPEDTTVKSKEPVSILKKTPSPPSAQKLLTPNLPKKIRIEADALRYVSEKQNSQTIHFPCSSDYVSNTNVRNLFSPQALLSPHLDKKYFDTSLVEIRSSHNSLSNSTKSLDKSGHLVLDDEVWVKRAEIKKIDSGKISDTSSTTSAGSSRAGIVS